MTALSEEARRKAAEKKGRFRPVMTASAREALRRRAQHTPYLDTMLATAKK